MARKNIRYIDLNTYNIRLLCFSDIYCDIEASIIDDLQTFNLLDSLNFKKHDTKKAFYFHIIKHICDVISRNNTYNKNVLYVCCNEIAERSQLFLLPESGCDQDRLCAFISTLLKRVGNLLPISFYNSYSAFDDLKNSECASVKETLISISGSIRNNKPKHIDFSKIKTFAKRYQLTYFNKGYFDQLKIKSIMYK